MAWKPANATPTLQKGAGANYQQVPDGWSADALIALHRDLRGTYPIGDFEIDGRFPRHEWRRYREILMRLSDGIRAGDLACSEIAVRFIERHFIGSGSGYLRSRLARALRVTELSKDHRARLNAHFLTIVRQQAYTCEFRDYLRIWELITTPEVVDQVVALYRERAEVSAPAWLGKLVAAAERRD